MYKINYLNQKTYKVSSVKNNANKVLLFNDKTKAIQHMNHILTLKAVSEGFYDVVEVKS